MFCTTKGCLKKKRKMGTQTFCLQKCTTNYESKAWKSSHEVFVVVYYLNNSSSVNLIRVSPFSMGASCNIQKGITAVRQRGNFLEGCWRWKGCDYLYSDKQMRDLIFSRSPSCWAHLGRSEIFTFGWTEHPCGRFLSPSWIQALNNSDFSEGENSLYLVQIRRTW